MPTLAITVTDAQAARIQAALQARYDSEPQSKALAVAPLAEQARAFLLNELRILVREYEQAVAQRQAIASVSEL